MLVVSLLFLLHLLLKKHLGPFAIVQREGRPLWRVYMQRNSTSVRVFKTFLLGVIFFLYI